MNLRPPNASELKHIQQDIKSLETRRQASEMTMPLGLVRRQKALRLELAARAIQPFENLRATRPGDPVSTHPSDDTVTATWDLEDFDVIERDTLFQREPCR